ncbi:MAG: hypothetical protein EBU11_07175 [Gammaproteobacteria bacterium]|jgi:hypothetical protein|nr:hypothetical protein [Gammaproteobacteria bacterium]
MRQLALKEIHRMFRMCSIATGLPDSAASDAAYYPDQSLRVTQIFRGQTPLVGICPLTEG